MNKGKEIQENGVVKFNYKALQAQAKELGLPTTGKAQAISDAIDAYFEANPIEVKVERRGRPINPNSPRQQRLSQVGKVGRGRPADPNSAWNIKQAAIAAKKAALGENFKLGRQVNPESARQKRLAMKGKLPLGRPKTKVEEPVATTTATPAAEIVSASSVEA